MCNNIIQFVEIESTINGNVFFPFLKGLESFIDDMMKYCESMILGMSVYLSLVLFFVSLYYLGESHIVTFSLNK